MLADRLKKTVNEVQRDTSSSQFLLWKVYLEMEVNFFHREDYYFAQISAQLHNMFADKKDRISVEDAIFDFVLPEKVDLVEVEATVSDVKVAPSTSHWLQFVGLDENGQQLEEHKLR